MLEHTYSYHTSRREKKGKKGNDLVMEKNDMLDSNVNLTTLLTAPPGLTLPPHLPPPGALPQRPQHRGPQGPTTVPCVSLTLFCGKGMTELCHPQQHRGSRGPAEEQGRS